MLAVMFAIGVDPYLNDIPGPSQRVRPEVAGPMTSFMRSPESIIADFEYRYELGNQKTAEMDSVPADFVRVAE
jgi:hypothetical protein